MIVGRDVTRLDRQGVCRAAVETVAENTVDGVTAPLFWGIVCSLPAAALAVAGRLRLFTNATSLGSTESLVEHRASIEGPTSTTPRGLLRLSVGLEHAQDLLDDLAQALDA